MVHEWTTNITRVALLISVFQAESIRAADFSEVTVPLSISANLGTARNDQYFLGLRLLSTCKFEAFPNYPVGTFRIGPHFEYAYQQQLTQLSHTTDTNLRGQLWSLGLAARIWFTNRLYFQLAVDPLGALDLGRATESGKDASFRDLFAGFHLKTGYRAIRKLPQLTVDLNVSYYQYRTVEIGGDSTPSHTREWMAGVGLSWRLGPWLPSLDTLGASERLEVNHVDRGLEVTIPNTSFDLNSSKLNAGALPTLKGLAEALAKNPRDRIFVEGYTDPRGDPELNQRLSEARAASVRAYLIENGVDANRISSQGFGLDNPIADNSTEEGRARNRRVQVRIERIKDLESAGEGQ